ncbi:BON domain-containing protein [Roseimaritima ulvae]|uniref:Periplasmic protein n=1 Tax=Roseimaritima ulvae TaxID=980254 RepID=A0A5B9QPW9_9BACT|nr:BON domain-containing protein [Roseimaritima ulvae]QEG39959.1 periplasmic protein [Roseimaritima ulvae]
MRRFFCAAAVLALAATCPLAGWAGDREIAEQIISRLKVQRDAGTLKGFKLDLKVEEGVVLLKGKVSDADQKTAVLAAAEGLDGIAEVVDQIAVQDAPVAAPAAPTKVAENKSEGFSFREALQREASKTRPMPVPVAEFEGAYTATEQAPAAVAPASANEQAHSDDAVTASVISALGRAQKDGHLRGFGVDVTTEGGKVVLNGRASTAAHKALIVDLARNTRGVTGVVDNIAVFSPQPLKTGNARPLQDPRTPQTSAVQPAAHPAVTAAANVPAAAPMPTRVAANYGMAGGVHGQPMPMAPYAGGQAAPRYDQPYLPNYAWPGYAAYPNYAALSYPQQYSPSAWPYIGPFYPYPQVPLGWRKVSLEWDDGWWFLDFTDRNGRH